MPTNYVTLDLFTWQEQGALKLSPKFQRRSIWKPAARSYLMDTMLRGFPVPPIHIRLLHDPKRGPLREVIDGQQRLRALFDFIAGKYRLSRQLQPEWANKTFLQLSAEDRSRIEMYKFHVFQYQGVDDATILEIFARINTYSVALNRQELRNGRFFGYFKRTVYELALEYLQAWRGLSVFSEAAIARMHEAELVGELLVMQLDGLQDKKVSLDDFYAHLDEAWGDEEFTWETRKQVKPRQWLSQAEAADRFRKTMSNIMESVGDVVADSEFSRAPLFYSLYGAVYHRLYGLPGFDRSTPKAALNIDAQRRLRDATEGLSALLSDDMNESDLSGWRKDFVVAAARQTDNLGPRRQRLQAIWDQADLGA